MLVCEEGDRTKREQEKKRKKKEGEGKEEREYRLIYIYIFWEGMEIDSMKFFYLTFHNTDR